MSIIVDKALAKLGTNPFSDTYYLKQLKKYSFKEIDKGDIRVVHSNLPFGIHLNYLYENLYEQKEKFPVLFIKGTLFMSLSRMEVESHFMPIKLAKGVVGVGGLGLGYYVQSILSKPSVKSVTVYETNQDVIDYYYSNFGKHPKLTIVNRDVFTIHKQMYNFFYMDIYEKACDGKALGDMKVIMENNYIETYHFWTIEAFVQAMIREYEHDHMRLMSNVNTRLLVERYLEYLVLLEEFGVKLINYLDGKEVFEKIVE